jgi:hypothetical protein
VASSVYLTLRSPHKAPARVPAAPSTTGPGD